MSSKPGGGALRPLADVRTGGILRWVIKEARSAQAKLSAVDEYQCDIANARELGRGFGRSGTVWFCYDLAVRSLLIEAPVGISDQRAQICGRRNSCDQKMTWRRFTVSQKFKFEIFRESDNYVTQVDGDQAAAGAACISSFLLIRHQMPFRKPSRQPMGGS